MAHPLDALIRPRSVAVLGASARRQNNGSVVLRNLRAAGFAPVIPVHAEAASIEDYATVPAIEALPPGTDLAVVSVPAAGVLDALRALERAGVAAAIIMSNGFSAAEDAALAAFAAQTRLLLQGPNCMGLLNFSDRIPLYTAIPSPRVVPGRAALIAQSGSAAIAVMNSTDVGFSKVITSGSQVRLSAADFLTWLAGDAETVVAGMVLESIPDADGFAAAIEAMHAAGKAAVVLKVGQSTLGAAAAQAHTGALLRDRDATDAFFRRHGVPTVRDYDELVAALEAFATIRARRPRNRIAIAGISGSEAALTCDLAETMGVPIAHFTAETTAALAALLPGVPGHNPVDFGASVSAVGTRREDAALDLIAADPGVDTVLVLQDAQASLGTRTIARYVQQCRNVAGLGARTMKGVAIASSSGEALHPELTATLVGTAIPLLRGLRPALAAMACLDTWCARTPEPRGLVAAEPQGERKAVQEAIAGSSGPLSGALVARLLDAYGLPRARLVVVQGADDPAAAAIGFPMVVKIVSRQVPHRSERGGVRLGIRDVAGLRAAIQGISENVRRTVPDVEIDGYELQEELSGCIEAMVGFKATPPFGALVAVGTGGTLVELQNDRALGLGRLTPDEAAAMIRSTRLGALLGGYRNLVPATSIEPLAALICALSELAADLHEVLVACDLNPVMVRPGSGNVRIVDALFVAG